MTSGSHQVKLGNRTVGGGAPTFVTFEAGPTHSGFESAKQLIALAAEAGADAVKFQVLDPDRLVADRKQLFTYDVLIDRATGKTETVSEPLYDLLLRRSLSRQEWRGLKNFADGAGVAFFATAGFEDEIDFLAGIGCHSIKIASADVNYFSLIKHAARTGLCLQIDTGNSTIGEIESAVDAIAAEGNPNVIIHHCPSGYPAKAEAVNLRVIPTLALMFGLPVAYSDHSPGWEMDIAAIAMGANLVEKTITMDRMTRSVEHVMSLDPPEMKAFVKSIRALDVAMGKTRREMTPAERTKRLAVRRSAHAAKNLASGHRLTLADVEFRRPGTGIAPDRIDEVLGLRLRTPKQAGERLAVSDLEP